MISNLSTDVSSTTLISNKQKLFDVAMAWREHNLQILYYHAAIHTHTDTHKMNSITS